MAIKQNQLSPIAFACQKPLKNTWNSNVIFFSMFLSHLKTDLCSYKNTKQSKFHCTDTLFEWILLTKIVSELFAGKVFLMSRGKSYYSRITWLSQVWFCGCIAVNLPNWKDVMQFYMWCARSNGSVGKQNMSGIW